MKSGPILSKSCPKNCCISFFYFYSDTFQIRQKVNTNLGYFCWKICPKNFSKVVQFGRTAHPLTRTHRSKESDYSAKMNSTTTENLSSENSVKINRLRAFPLHRNVRVCAKLDSSRQYLGSLLHTSRVKAIQPRNFDFQYLRIPTYSA